MSAKFNFPPPAPIIRPKQIGTKEVEIDGKKYQVKVYEPWYPSMVESGGNWTARGRLPGTNGHRLLGLDVWWEDRERQE